MNFDKIKQNQIYSKYDVNLIKNIFTQIERKIKEDVGFIVSLINEDNKLFAENFAYSKLIEAIDRAQKELWYLENKSKSLIIDGIGNLGVIYNESPELLIYLGLKALKTHNNIVFFEKDFERKTSKYIVEIINDILLKNDYKALILIEKINCIKDAIYFQDYIDLYVCIGQSSDYHTLKENTKIDILYSAYGTLSLYMDDKSLKNILLDIDEYIFKNNIILNLYKDKNIKKVIDEINNKGENYCSVIFTKDIKKASYFLEHVDSQNLYVNKNPFSNYVFDLDDRNITKIKNIFID